MAKKVTKSNSGVGESMSAAAPAKAKATSPARVKKHVKAQAVAVAAAVEGFVQTLVESRDEAPNESVTQTSAAVATAKQISHEEISKLAYQFYLDRGNKGGSATDDWFRALQTLRVS